MSVDLISHFTPQKIFNKSKRKKKKRIEGLLSQVSEMESPIGNWSQSFGGFTEETSVCYFFPSF